MEARHPDVSFDKFKSPKKCLNEPYRCVFRLFSFSMVHFEGVSCVTAT